MTCVKVVGPGRAKKIICLLDEDDKLVIPYADCPNAVQHTPHPVGYVAHSDWADQMLKTHRQKRCDGCGILNIWEPKDPASGGVTMGGS